MFGAWTPVIALVASLLALLLAKRWITNHLQELSVRWVGDPDVALIVYFVTVLPGVIVHELSHWLAAKLLGVRVASFPLGRFAKGEASAFRWVRCGWAMSIPFELALSAWLRCWVVRPSF